MDNWVALLTCALASQKQDETTDENKKKTDRHKADEGQRFLTECDMIYSLAGLWMAKAPFISLVLSHNKQQKHNVSSLSW